MPQETKTSNSNVHVDSLDNPNPMNRPSFIANVLAFDDRNPYELIPLVKTKSNRWKDTILHYSNEYMDRYLLPDAKLTEASPSKYYLFMDNPFARKSDYLFTDEEGDNREVTIPEGHEKFIALLQQAACGKVEADTLRKAYVEEGDWKECGGISTFFALTEFECPQRRHLASVLLAPMLSAYKDSGKLAMFLQENGHELLTSVSKVSELEVILSHYTPDLLKKEFLTNLISKRDERPAFLSYIDAGKFKVAERLYQEYKKLQDEEFLKQVLGEASLGKIDVLARYEQYKLDYILMACEELSQNCLKDALRANNHRFLAIASGSTSAHLPARFKTYTIHIKPDPKKTQKLLDYYQRLGMLAEVKQCFSIKESPKVVEAESEGSDFDEISPMGGGMEGLYPSITSYGMGENEPEEYYIDDERKSSNLLCRLVHKREQQGSNTVEKSNEPMASQGLNLKMR